jgi:hypothetical protein
MSVSELQALARKHWMMYLPTRVRELNAAGEQDRALQGAATEIDQLMGWGYQESEAREVVLPKFILLPEEKMDDEQVRELAEKEAAYHRNPPWQATFYDEDYLPIR